MLRQSTLLLFAFLVLGNPAPLCGQSAQAPFDLLILGGHIVDGTGNPWYAADVGIRDGRITAIGRLSGAAAKRRIDAHGLVVAPGFIDMLGQSETTLLIDPRAESKIRQGITTEITGEGWSVAPENEKTLPEDEEAAKPFGIKIDWRSLADYFARLERQGTAINFGTNVGATQVRRAVVGSDDRAPSPAEFERMKQLVAEAMEQGAMGISTSLVYAPAIYAKTEELIELARVASRSGGVYSSHIRNEGATIFEALDEAFRIGREAQIPVHIYHLKVAGKPMWGRMGEVIARIERARAEGLEVTADMYPYIAGATSLGASLPAWALEGGTEETLARLRDLGLRQRMKDEINRGAATWQNFYFSSGGGEGVLISYVANEKLKSLQGKRLAEVAKLRGQDVLDALFDILIEDHLQTSGIYFLMDEKDVEHAIPQPWMSYGCDAPAVRPDGILGSFPSHPRAYGTFPRVLGHYVRELKLTSLEQAIRKMTSLPAQTMRISDRGALKPGMWADVVIFDADKIRDVATFETPNQYSDGMRSVIVNGQLVLDDGRMTAALPGRVLRGAGWPGYRQLAEMIRNGARLLDLTYTINDHIPYWPSYKSPFSVTVEKTFERDGYFSRSFSMLEHYGTHMDAPAHFAVGQAAVDAVPLARLFAPAVVVDVSAHAAKDADCRLTVEDLKLWEQEHGRISPNAVVFLRTGWGARWNDATRYANGDATGVLHFPGFSVAAAEFLTNERNVAGLGIDTLSVDYGPSKDFEVHRLTHSRGLYHLENVANLEQLPATGALVVVAPIKLEGGSGGPVRIFAVLP